MTKEEFIKELMGHDRVNAATVSVLMDKFLSKNICIPRSNNRHTHADLIHAYAEGATLECRVPTCAGMSEWSKLGELKFSYDTEYRIKSLEPIYEWQWLHISKQANVCRGFTIDYYTEDEVGNDVYNWVKIEETKRVRQ